LAGWFDSEAEVLGIVAQGALVVSAQNHCRLSNISPEGTWVKSETFLWQGREVKRISGNSVGKLMLPWRRLRHSNPELLENLSVYTQPSGNVDSIILTWMIEELSEQFPQTLWQRDCF